jgi:hypothetical protein
MSPHGTKRTSRHARSDVRFPGVKQTSQFDSAVSANDAVDGSSPRHVSAMGHSGIWSFPNIRTAAPYMPKRR